MDMDQAAVWFSGSILFMLGFIVIAAGITAINNIFHKYWKPVTLFTKESFGFFGFNNQGAGIHVSDKEYEQLVKHLEKMRGAKKVEPKLDSDENPG